MAKLEPTLGESLSLILAAMPHWLEDLSHAGWRPHRVFTGKLEPISSYHQRLSQLYNRSIYGNSEQLRELAFDVTSESIGTAERHPNLPIGIGFADLFIGLLVQNDLAFEFPKLDPGHADNEAYAMPLRRRLADIEPYLVHEKKILSNFVRTIATFIIGICDEDLPEAAIGYDVETSKPTLSAPLLSLMPNPQLFVAKIVATFLRESQQSNDATAALPFSITRNQIIINTLAASNLTPEQFRASPTKLVLPEASQLPPMQLAETYLAHTPFAEFIKLSIPFTIPLAARFEHCHIIGGTGHGKTQLLQTLALADFDDPTAPSVVIIDSQGDMVRKLSRLKCFANSDRLIIVDPSDTEFPLALNIFDIHRERLDALTLGQREQILAGIIELYDYIFGAIGADLTQKQSVVFRYITRLMLDIPHANIQTLRELMEDDKPFRPYIDRLTGTTKAFFDNEFADRSFVSTKQQIRRRLYGILSNPTFERLFSSDANKLDMTAALDSGKVILINTAKDVLKSEASAFFGRYMIALVMQAAFERAAQKEEQRRPAFLYIDEAADYFDGNIDTLLIQARKFKLSVTLAHQFLDQLTPSLRASIMTNPAVRFAGGVSQKDANALDSDMRTTAGFLMGMHKKREETEFACYVRNVTHSAVKLVIPIGSAEREPQMTEDEYAAALARSRALVATPLVLVTPVAAPARVTPSPTPAPVDDPTKASEW